MIGVEAGLASPLLHDGRLYVPDDGGHAALLRRQDRQEALETEVRHGWPAAPRSGPTAKSTSPRSTPTSTSSRTRDRSARSCTTSSSRAQGGLGRDQRHAGRGRRQGDLRHPRRPVLPGEEGRRAAGRAAAGRGQAVAAISGEAAATASAGPPAHAQVVPADVTLAPGESVTFKVRLFDKDGNFVSESPGRVVAADAAEDAGRAAAAAAQGRDQGRHADRRQGTARSAGLRRRDGRTG